MRSVEFTHFIRQHYTTMVDAHLWLMHTAVYERRRTLNRVHWLVGLGVGVPVCFAVLYNARAGKAFGVGEVQPLSLMLLWLTHSYGRCTLRSRRIGLLIYLHIGGLLVWG